MTNSNNESTAKLFTLTVIRRNGKVLLGLKKRGFGVGKLDSFGGKVEDGESIEEAAKRYVQIFDFYKKFYKN